MTSLIVLHVRMKKVTLFLFLVSVKMNVEVIFSTFIISTNIFRKTNGSSTKPLSTESCSHFFLSIEQLLTKVNGRHVKINHCYFLIFSGLSYPPIFLIIRSKTIINYFLTGGMCMENVSKRGLPTVERFSWNMLY